MGAGRENASAQATLERECDQELETVLCGSATGALGDLGTHTLF